MKILSFGEILWDVYPDKKYIGGAPLNFAAHAARHGHNAYMLSALGKDDLGKEALEKLNKWNIGTETVSYPEKPTGKCLVSLDKNSVPSYNLLRDVAYDYISTDNLPDNFDILYFGVLALRGEHNFNSLTKLLKTNHFKEVFVDVNLRPPFYSEDRVLFAVQNATVLKISLEELNTVSHLLGMNETDYKAFSKVLAERFKNLKCIVITLGSDGAYAYDTLRKTEYCCPAEKVKVVSTVGAGDSFSASFIHKYLKGEALKNCLSYASKVASFVVSKFDAIPDYSPEDFE